MRIHAERTGAKVKINGVRCHEWQGTTSKGAAVALYSIHGFVGIAANLESTEQLVEHAGAEARVWDVLENGRKLLVHRVRILEGREGELEPELIEAPTPREPSDPKALAWRLFV